jgi:hypothetical protein
MACYQLLDGDRDLDSFGDPMRTTDIEYGPHFEGKPRSRVIFEILAERIASLGPSDVTVASQISWGRSRKFAWYNVA